MEAHSFDPQSRVWIYTSSRLLSDAEVDKLENAIDDFCTGWTAHNQQLHAGGLVVYNRYIILVVDETQAGASGCSIDKSVHFLQEMGKALHSDFFTRNLVAYAKGDSIEWIDFKEIPSLLASGELNADTKVFDTSASTYGELKNWKKPLAQTWMSRYLKTAS